MEKIHHQHVKRAEKMGVTLTPEPEYNRVVAFWPAHNLRIYGQDARYAIQQMLAAQKVIQENAEHTIKIVNDPRVPWNVLIVRNGEQLDGSMPPIMWAEEELMDHIPNEEYPGEVTDPGETSGPNSGTKQEFREDKNPLTIEGVPTDGKLAHQKGFAIVDNPFMEGDEGDDGNADFARWNEEWEASAGEALDEKPEEEEPEEKIGSVVKTKYRAIYAERGHPTHCGDELAVKLNNLVLDGSRCNIEYFKMIMDANNVDMSKYRTTGNGWQGRYRMTGRNKLAKVVHSNGGLLKLPNGEELRMSQDWVSSQRFK
jgi:hypothetical protein